METPVETFNRNDPKYRCCCSHCHVRTGCVVIGIFEMIWCVQIGFGLESGVLLALLWLIIWSSVTWYVLSLFFVGLAFQKSYFLLPHLIYQVVSFIAFGISIVIMIVGLSTEDEFILWFKMPEKNPGRAVGFTFLALFLLFRVLSLALNIWFFTIVLACYRYLKAQEQWRKPTVYICGGGPPKTPLPDGIPPPSVPKASDVPRLHQWILSDGIPAQPNVFKNVDVARLHQRIRLPSVADNSLGTQPMNPTETETHQQIGLPSVAGTQPMSPTETPEYQSFANETV